MTEYIPGLVTEHNPVLLFQVFPVAVTARVNNQGFRIQAPEKIMEG